MGRKKQVRSPLSSTLSVVVMIIMVMLYLWDKYGHHRHHSRSHMTDSGVTTQASQLVQDPHFPFPTRTAPTFLTTKHWAAKVYVNHRVDYYCGCQFNEERQVDASTCPFRPRVADQRARVQRGKRIEWEHVVTAWQIGHQRPCWHHGGRKNCERNDPDFRKMAFDLHNLLPVVGEINADRSNFPYAQWSSPQPLYGGCQFYVDFKRRLAMPPPNIRGNLARINFYMYKTYHLPLSAAQLKLFQQWNKEDPVDQWELQRDRNIARIQGNSNCFVTQTCTLHTP